MKGLLVKDFLLIKGQARFFLLVIGIAALMSFTMNDPSFIMGYLTIVISIFSLSSISYDEFNNGNAFLFTLPVTRRKYVLEKYLFSGILGTAALLLSVVLSLILGFIQDMVPSFEVYLAAPAILALMLLFLALMLPIQLKFGAEKGRVVMIATFGGVFLLGLGGVKLAKALGVDLLEGLIALLQNHLPLAVGLGLLAIAGAVLLSIRISICIMEKKEF